MPTYTNIYVRSPWLIEDTETAGDDIKVELYLWNDPDSQPGSPTHTLEKPIPSSVQTTVYFDISPYCREYITHDQFTPVTTPTASPVAEYCYCHVKTYVNDVAATTYDYICFDGYGEYADGKNPTISEIHMDAGTYLYDEDDSNRGAIYVHDDQVASWDVKYTGLTTGGTTTQAFGNEVNYVPYVHTSYLSEGNTCEIRRATVTQKTFTFKPTCEGRYTPIVCDFVNKYGAWQRIIFFKVSKQTMNMVNKEFHLMPDDANYDTTLGTRKTFNTNMNTMIVCNTGWVEETYDDVIKQLLLSERITLDNVPVILDTKSVQRLQSVVQDELSYQLQFKYAYLDLNYYL